MKVRQREPAGNNVKLTAGERKSVRIGNLEIELRRQAARDCEHPRRNIDTDHRRCAARDGSGDGPSAASQIEHAHTRPGRREFRDALNQLGECRI